MNNVRAKVDTDFFMSCSFGKCGMKKIKRVTTLRHPFDSAIILFLIQFAMELEITQLLKAAFR